VKPASRPRRAGLPTISTRTQLARQLCACAVAFGLAVIGPAIAIADEGFWGVDHLPLARVKERYGVTLDPAVLRHAALATVDTAMGAGGFVSPQGLVIMKHGAVKPCLHSLRDARKTTGHFASVCRDMALRAALPLLDKLICAPLDRAVAFDYIENGFLARSQKDELRCPSLRVSALAGIDDVTQEVQAELARAPLEKRPQTERAIRTRIEGACRKEAGLICRLVKFYDGARWELHRTRDYEDVRVVFAAERKIADVGDLQDHITFPDHDFKAAFVRVYDHGRPLATPSYFRLSPRLPAEGELLLMSGYPGPTGRHAPARQLEFRRDIAAIAGTTQAEVRGIVTELIARRPTAFNIDIDAINHNNLLYANQMRALSNQAFLRRDADERALLDTLGQRHDPDLPAIGGALAKANQAYARYSYFREPVLLFIGSDMAGSSLLRYALAASRLIGGDKGNKDTLTSPNALDEEMEIARLALTFRKVAEMLPGGDPVLEKILDGRAPRERANDLVHLSRLSDPGFRQALADGIPAAVAAAKADPMVVFVTGLLPEIREATRRRAEVTAQISHASNLLEAARYRLYGDDVYPDGNDTLRISFGSLRGYQDFGHAIAPVTTFADLYARARDVGPYQFPARWVAARGKLSPTTPLNVASNHDGMIGSALLFDPRGALVGLMFNGNRYYPGLADTYDETKRRMVSVHMAAVLEALDKVYGAAELLHELAAGDAPIDGAPDTASARAPSTKPEPN
jgi:hypothetical protein